ncbi:hypothetical protein C8Q73DRAFT_460143 [Cubamyces lactineus]|nr:hypothetical protein C8Q73DRAFT_460143 [Cubamyces lactineus]
MLIADAHHLTGGMGGGRILHRYGGIDSLGLREIVQAVRPPLKAQIGHTAVFLTICHAELGLRARWLDLSAGTRFVRRRLIACIISLCDGDGDPPCTHLSGTWPDVVVARTMRRACQLRPADGRIASTSLGTICLGHGTSRRDVRRRASHYERVKRGCYTSEHVEEKYLLPMVYLVPIPGEDVGFGMSEVAAPAMCRTYSACNGPGSSYIPKMINVQAFLFSLFILEGSEIENKGMHSAYAF